MEDDAPGASQQAALQALRSDAWVNDGLGSDNADLPAYVVLLSGPPGQSRYDRREVLDAVKALSQYEMAFRMQASMIQLYDAD